MNFLRLIVLLAVPFVGFAASAKTEVLAPATLREGEVIKIEFTSTGCFHFYTKFYEIRRQGAVVLMDIAVLRQKWDEPTKRLLTLGTEKLGSLELTERESDGLGALLTYYRKPPGEGWWSTTDTLRVRYERGEQEVGREEFRDSTGMVDNAEWRSSDGKLKSQLSKEDWDLLSRVISIRKIEGRLKLDKPEKP